MGYDTMDCMVLGSAMDGEDGMVSGDSSSNSGQRGQALSAQGSVRAMLRSGGARGGGRNAAPPVEHVPVECIKIGTDSTLLMSVLEAGDIMIIKDALQYFGGGRMVARDLALNNSRPATAGTLVILPLVHRCRSLGCVYVFARNEFNLSFSRAAWADLAAMLSRAVFGQLVGKLRHEWYAVLSEDPQQAPRPVEQRGRVRRTITGNSLCSNASSLRPSFEIAGRSMDPGGTTAAGNQHAAEALAAAAEALAYAGLMMPASDEPPLSAAAVAGAAAVLAPISGGVPPPPPAASTGNTPSLTVAGATAAVNAMVLSARGSTSGPSSAGTPPGGKGRHRIPPEHAASSGGGFAASSDEQQSSLGQAPTSATLSQDPAAQQRSSGEEPAAPATQPDPGSFPLTAQPDLSDPGQSDAGQSPQGQGQRPQAEPPQDAAQPPVGPDGEVSQATQASLLDGMEGAAAAVPMVSSPTSTGPGRDALSPTPGSLSFTLPPGIDGGGMPLLPDVAMPRVLASASPFGSAAALAAGGRGSGSGALRLAQANAASAQAAADMLTTENIELSLQMPAPSGSGGGGVVGTLQEVALSAAAAAAAAAAQPDDGRKSSPPRLRVAAAVIPELSPGLEHPMSALTASLSGGGSHVLGSQDGPGARTAHGSAKVRVRVLDTLPSSIASEAAAALAGTSGASGVSADTPGPGHGSAPPMEGGELGEDGDLTGSSRELQGWPELVDILYDMNRTRNVSVYLAAYRGRAVAVKMMRSHMSMDGRPGHLESEAMTIAAQQLLSTVRHPNILRVLMVYPLVYEVVAGSAKGAAGAAGRHGSGPPIPSGSFNTHHGGGGAAAAFAAGGSLGAGGRALHLAAAQPHLYGSGGAGGGLSVQAHALADLLAGAAGADLPAGGVYLTAVLPRREKFKRGLALMLELFPSLSLREALQRRMLLLNAAATSAPQDGTNSTVMGYGGGGGVSTADSLGGPPYGASALSEAGYPTTPAASGPQPYFLGAGLGAPGAAASGGLGSTGPPPPSGGGGGGVPSLVSPHHASAAGFLQPHGFLPTLPETRVSRDDAGPGTGPFSAAGHAVPHAALVAGSGFPVSNTDTAPAFGTTTITTLASNNNSGGGSGHHALVGISGGGGGGGGGGSTPHMSVLLSILQQVAAGMAALHAAGMAHGELRPENVLLALPPGSAAGMFGGGGGGVGTGHGGDGGTPRVTPPTPRTHVSGANLIPSGNSGNGRRAGARVSYSSGRGGNMSVVQTERYTAERPMQGRSIGPEVIVKIKDAGMTVVGFSKGAQSVRKLLQRNRSTLLPFLPPEVHRGERFGRSADVYMFGLLMWELYTGGVAFSNLTGTPIKLLQTVIADGVRPPWPDGVPGWYMSMASRCWAGNPKQRPSFRRIVDKLQEVASAQALASSAAAAGWVGVSSFHA